MSTDRLKAKIAALRAKTTAAGCTEAEAMAAAETAARLMEDHGLSEAELVMTDARSRERSRTNTWRLKLASTIAQCTNTAHILTNESVLFIGRAPGPEIAAYLRDVCVRAVEGELKAYKAGTFYRRRRALWTKRAAAADFADGMTHRLQDRVWRLFGRQRDAHALAAAKQVLALRFPETESVRDRRNKTQFVEALAAGIVAGDRVHLQHGVSADAPRQLEFTGKRS